MQIDSLLLLFCSKLTAHLSFSVEQNPAGLHLSVHILDSSLLVVGTPVNRIPIMAKQVLDLYMLYKLVTEKGGLVEVINKKLWREITKGLNLPTSITSAAFTLRTQSVHSVCNCNNSVLQIKNVTLLLCSVWFLTTSFDKAAWSLFIRQIC